MNYQFSPDEVVKIREVLAVWGPKSAFVYYHQLIKGTTVPQEDLESFIHQLIAHYETVQHA